MFVGTPDYIFVKRSEFQDFAALCCFGLLNVNFLFLVFNFWLGLLFLYNLCSNFGLVCFYYNLCSNFGLDFLTIGCLLFFLCFDVFVTMQESSILLK